MVCKADFLNIDLISGLFADGELNVKSACP